MKIILHFTCPALEWSIKVWIHAVADLNLIAPKVQPTHCTRARLSSLLRLDQSAPQGHLPCPGRVLILVIWPPLS